MTGTSPGPDPRDPDSAKEAMAALVTRAQAGDDQAFEELVAATYVDTYTLARRLTGNDDDARDVVQEAYLRAYRALGRFRGDARFSTWLYRITANCASTYTGRRRRHRHDELVEDMVVVDTRPEFDPEAQADASDLRVRVASALDDLPPKLRAVVILRDVYDLPHEAIAAELGISESAAKVRLHRARRKLKDQLFPGRAAADRTPRTQSTDRAPRPRPDRTAGPGGHGAAPPAGGPSEEGEQR